jgi:arylsulfatase A-like enzyme
VAWTLRVSCAAISVLLTGSAFADPEGQVTIGDRPNILLIVADDLGYADLGIYGGDIETPNIDSLARAGLLFTQFHTAPMCAPTRAMLLSGNNNHVAGMAHQSQIGVGGHPMPGYEAHLSDRIVPFPGLVRDSGYHTYIVGKWHLGMAAEDGPVAAGFERAFTLLDGAAAHFNSVGIRAGGSTYREGEELVDYPEGRYSTDFYTDKLIEYIDAGKGDGKPFLAAAMYTSPHWPLQVPEEYLDLYRGRYDAGYDALRERRFESLKSAGIIPARSNLPPRNPAITPWEDLNAEEQKREARKMELYAAMVDNLDDHVGRLLDYLRDNDLFRSTIIVFMSDNGAANEDFYNTGSYRDLIRELYDNAYEKMGTAESFVSYGPQWAEAGSAPFQRYKGYTREGGIVAPMMISGRGVSHRGSISSAYVTVMDLAPTILEIAGASYPDDGSVRPILGESMSSLLSGTAESVHDDRYVTTLFHRGRAMLRKGSWKISTLEAPFDESDFALFDLSLDPGEANNLANDKPGKFAELIEVWRKERKRLGIILPEDL